MLADHVFCGTCMKEMLVNVGAEHCPFCNAYGTLQFRNKHKREVEISYMLQNTKWVCEAGWDASCEYGFGASEEEAVEDAISKGPDTTPEYYYTEEILYEEVIE